MEGFKPRQFVVCGDEGTLDICPLETYDSQPPQPTTLQLALSKARDSYKEGYQEVTYPEVPARYDDQRIELAQIIRGEIESPYPIEHERIVQECLMEACGYPLTWVNPRGRSHSILASGSRYRAERNRCSFSIQECRTWLPMAKVNEPPCTSPDACDSMTCR